MPRAQRLFPDSFETMVGNLLRVGIFSWSYDEVFKHHINGASTQIKATALQWEHRKITSCYLLNQVISTLLSWYQVISTDISLVATDLFSFKEVGRNSSQLKKMSLFGHSTSKWSDIPYTLNN